MQNAPREHSAILSTCIKVPSAFKTFVLSIFDWLLKTGFTVLVHYRWYKNTRELLSLDWEELCQGEQRDQVWSTDDIVLCHMQNRERSGSVVECLTRD